MTLVRIFNIVIAGLLLVTAGCDPEPSLDKAKFAELRSASQDLMAALRSGGQCAAPAAVVDRLAAGATALQGKAVSKAERDLLFAYEGLVVMSRDALHLCRSRGHLTSFQFVPKGRIYVSQDLDAVVERYDLATESHVYKATGARWRSISTDSMEVIWKKAEALIKNIEVMLTYS
ncbi:MAG: hypothetical protein OEW15_12525 [Nitrospirota bacterium]|nr:hypothetical protein [Nitrospirota bacterium]